MTLSLYPLRFKEILRDYRFGNRWIVEAFEKTDLPEPPHHVGETWEVCDRPNGESSPVINGALTGETLHTLIATSMARPCLAQISWHAAARAFPC